MSHGWLPASSTTDRAQQVAGALIGQWKLAAWLKSAHSRRALAATVITRGAQGER